jgi:hypothetical protein
MSQTFSYQNSSDPMDENNTTEFLLRGLEEQCDYKFIFLDCDAMTTTTTTTTTASTTIIETTISTIETTISTTTPWFVFLSLLSCLV